MQKKFKKRELLLLSLVSLYITFSSLLSSSSSDFFSPSHFFSSFLLSFLRFLQTDPVSLLDVEVTDLDRRVGLCVGSTDEVRETLGQIPDEHFEYRGTKIFVFLIYLLFFRCHQITLIYFFSLNPSFPFLPLPLLCFLFLVFLSLNNAAFINCGYSYVI